MTLMKSSTMTLAALVLCLPALASPPPGQLPPEFEPPGYSDKPGPPPAVAKGPCKKIGEKFEVGMKLYLTTDHRFIGEVTVYRPSHLFADGKSREAVKVKLADGKSTWLPADIARRIYVTQ